MRPFLFLDVYSCSRYLPVLFFSSSTIIINSMSRLFWALCLSLLASPVKAEQNYSDFLVNKANDLNLSSHKYWHKLVHYKKNWLGGYESQADDARYFLSKDGKYKPGNELTATIKSFFDITQQGDEHAQCRFPSRYHWLKTILKIDAKKLSDRYCPTLEEWKNTLNVKSATLVFPSSYLNSPSSMFGHTLLRVNPDDYRKGAPLAAYALNYAANMQPGEIGIVFAYKGIFGGYPGIFSIVPYYEKIKEYSDIENRDIWEYELDLTQAEVEQMMRHAWELKDIRFDYYFFTENCSYHMLSLLEVGREDLYLTDRFSVRAIPSDTVRVVKESGIVKDTVYRPSSSALFKQRNNVLNKQQLEIVRQLYEGEKKPDELTDMDANEKAMMVEQAFDYSRYRALREFSRRDENASQNYQLLLARSELETQGSVWPDVKVPDVRPDQGHETSRFAIGMTKANEEWRTRFQLRPAYHDVLDPWQGYGIGAQINFLDLEVDYYAQQDKFELNRFTLIDILSLSPRDQFFQPLSWFADFGVEYLDSRPVAEHVVQVNGGAGYTYKLGAMNLFSLLAKSKFRMGDKLDKGYSLSAGLNMTLMLNAGFGVTRLSAEFLNYRVGEETSYRSLTVEQSLYQNYEMSLKLKISHQLEYDKFDDRMELLVNWYF